MKNWRKRLLVLLVMSLTVVQVYSSCWAQAGPTDPMDQGLAMMDLLVARPVSFLAGIVGSVLFVVTLPVTASTNSVEASGDMFIYQPIRWAMQREFPDPSIIFPRIPLPIPRCTAGSENDLWILWGSRVELFDNVTCARRERLQVYPIPSRGNLQKEGYPSYLVVRQSLSLRWMSQRGRER